LSPQPSFSQASHVGFELGDLGLDIPITLLSVVRGFMSSIVEHKHNSVILFFAYRERVEQYHGEWAVFPARPRPRPASTIGKAYHGFFSKISRA
jgi:hypothetical protein